MGVLDKIFNRKNIRDASALTAAAGLMATGGGMQTTDKPPIPDNTNTPPTREFQTSESQPESKEINSITEDKTVIEPATGKKFIIPEGYKPEISKDGKVSFILKTIQDYRNGGAAVLRTKEERHQHNLQSTPVKPKEIPSQNNTEPQPTSDTTQFNETTTPLTADVNGDTPLNTGGKIHWENLSPTPSQEDRAGKKSNWLNPDKHNIKLNPDGQTETWTNKETGEEIIRPHRPLQDDGHIKEFPPSSEPKFYHLDGKPTKDEQPNTLDLTPQLKNRQSSISDYDRNDGIFGMPQNTPTDKTENTGNEDSKDEDSKDKDKKDKDKDNKNQTTPENQPSNKPQKERSPEPIKPPERLKVDGPTAIAKNERVSTEIPVEVSKAIKTINKYLPKLTKTQMTAILASILTGLTAIQETQASTISQEQIDNPTEHTLNSTKKETNDRATQRALSDFFNYPAKHHFKKVTPEQFLKQYGNKYPTVSADDIRDLMDKMGISANGRLNKYPKSPRFSTKDSTDATLKGLSNLPKAKMPNTKIKFGTRNNPYSTPETPQNLNFNPGKKGGNWDTQINGSTPEVPNYDIKSKGDMFSTPDIEPKATVGIGGFQNE